MNIPVYGLLHIDMFVHIVFLNKMAITFTVIILVMAAITLVRSLEEPKALPVRQGITPKTDPLAIRLGIIITIIIVARYLLFR